MLVVDMVGYRRGVTFSEWKDCQEREGGAKPALDFAYTQGLNGIL